MSISKHKSEQSIRSYSKSVTSDQKKSMAVALHRSCQGSLPKASSSMEQNRKTSVSSISNSVVKSFTSAANQSFGANGAVDSEWVLTSSQEYIVQEIVGNDAGLLMNHSDNSGIFCGSCKQPWSFGEFSQ